MTQQRISDDTRMSDERLVKIAAGTVDIWMSKHEQQRTAAECVTARARIAELSDQLAAKDARIAELEAQSGYGCLAMPIVVDPALPPDTIIFKDRQGRELGRIDNLGNYFEAKP